MQKFSEKHTKGTTCIRHRTYSRRRRCRCSLSLRLVIGIKWLVGLRGLRQQIYRHHRAQPLADILFDFLLLDFGSFLSLGSFQVRNTTLKSRLSLFFERLLEDLEILGEVMLNVGKRAKNQSNVTNQYCVREMKRTRNAIVFIISSTISRSLPVCFSKLALKPRIRAIWRQTFLKHE